MGWGDCGTDEDGRPIGYVFAATCDEEGCEAKIDRGLGYACGGMHGFNEWDCDKYFCGDHLIMGAPVQLCKACSQRHSKLPPEECNVDEYRRCLIHEATGHFDFYDSPKEG